MTARTLIVNAVTLSILILGITWLGCKSDSTTEPPGTTTPTVQAPTNLRAYSAGATSVGLLWDLSSSETDTILNGYLVVAKDPSGTVVASNNIAKGTPNTNVTSLTEGVIYTFVVRATGRGGIVSSDSASVRWSPARRYLNDSTLSIPIQVYELRSTVGASGLQFNSNGSYAKVRSLGVGNPDRFLCDMYVDSVGGGALCLKNIGLLTGYPRVTYFSTEPLRNVTDFTDPRTAPPDTNSYQLNRKDLPTGAVTQSVVLYAKTANSGISNYVRILVQRNQATGFLYYGSGSDRYLVLQLSYQNTPGNWFARPGQVSTMPQR